EKYEDRRQEWHRGYLAAIGVEEVNRLNLFFSMPAGQFWGKKHGLSDADMQTRTPDRETIESVQRLWHTTFEKRLAEEKERQIKDRARYIRILKERAVHKLRMALKKKDGGKSIRSALFAIKVMDPTNPALLRYEEQQK